VTVEPSLWCHKLVALLDELPNDLTQDLDVAFTQESQDVCGPTLRQALEQCEVAFATSRYPFEHGKDISDYPLRVLMVCSEFLAKFVGEMQPSERIDWR
jgi:hypothetical protein